MNTILNAETGAKIAPLSTERKNNSIKLAITTYQLTPGTYTFTGMPGRRPSGTWRITANTLVRAVSYLDNQGNPAGTVELREFTVAKRVARKSRAERDAEFLNLLETLRPVGYIKPHRRLRFVFAA